MTPCEKLGYKVGDRFEVVARDAHSHCAKIGTQAELTEDDGTAIVQFRCDSLGYTQYIHINDVRPLKTTITPGTYVDTSGMDEAGRREVVDLFIKAGVPEGEGYRHANLCWDSIGYNEQVGVFYHMGVPDEFTNKITLSQLREAAGVKVLPAVGSVVERKSLMGIWKECTVACHLTLEGGKAIAVVQYPESSGFGFDTSADPSDFRPVRSQREKDIEQLQTECKLKPKQAARVVDAGYVKP